MPTADRIRINHALALLANLDKLRRSEWECDYDIISKGQRFPVHKSVLAGCSTVLQSMVQMDRYQANFEIDPDGTKEVIKFMYSGTAEITEYNFQDLMHAAKEYQLDDLKTLCVNYVEHNLTIKNCFQKLRKCMVYRLDNSTRVIKFIKELFDDVMTTEEFKRLTQTSLSLRIKDLELPSHQLWQGIFSWVQHDINSRKPEMVKLVEENIDRFSLYTILNDMLQCELVNNSGRCGELILARILSESSRIKTLINANNCFKLSKLCANSPYSNTVLLQNGIVEFMIENVARIEDNEAIVDLPEEGIVALCQGIRRRNIGGGKTWKLALKWTKHKLAERQDTFPQLFSCVNLNDFTFEFINQVIREEELVKGSLACNQSVMDHVFKQHRPSPTYETPEKKPRIETLSTRPSTSGSYVSEKSKQRPYIVVYAKHSGKVVGFDLTIKKETGFSKKQTVKKDISKFTVVADDLQAAFTLKDDLYVLRGTKLKLYRQTGSKKYWIGKKSLDKRQASDVKLVTFQDRLHIVKAGKLIIYDPGSDCWLRRKISKVRGRKFAVCANSTTPYILGGEVNPQIALEYNPTTLGVREITSTIYPRTDASAVSVHENIYLLGGENGLAQKSIESYGPTKRYWTRINAEMEFSRWSFSACAYDGKIYAVGGKKDKSSKDCIEVYDTMAADSKWTKFCDIPTFQAPFNACVARLSDDEETTPMEVACSSHMY